MTFPYDISAATLPLLDSRGAEPLLSASFRYNFINRIRTFDENASDIYSQMQEINKFIDAHDISAIQDPQEERQTDLVTMHDELESAFRQQLVTINYLLTLPHKQHIISTLAQAVHDSAPESGFDIRPFCEDAELQKEKDNLLDDVMPYLKKMRYLFTLETGKIRQQSCFPEGFHALILNGVEIETGDMNDMMEFDFYQEFAMPLGLAPSLSPAMQGYLDRHCHNDVYLLSFATDVLSGKISENFPGNFDLDDLPADIFKQAWNNRHRHSGAKDPDLERLKALDAKGLIPVF
ncbi:MAG: hypothetical protein H6868_06520 [Rhodospirillales bacterium]|nr:hypothetical protein [Rhodospirillales bacterium]